MIEAFTHLKDTLYVGYHPQLQRVLVIQRASTVTPDELRYIRLETELYEGERPVYPCLWVDRLPEKMVPLPFVINDSPACDPVLIMVEVGGQYVHAWA